MFNIKTPTKQQNRVKLNNIKEAKELKRKKKLVKEKKLVLAGKIILMDNLKNDLFFCKREERKAKHKNDKLLTPRT